MPPDSTVASVALPPEKTSWTAPAPLTSVPLAAAPLPTNCEPAKPIVLALSTPPVRMVWLPLASTSAPLTVPATFWWPPLTRVEIAVPLASTFCTPSVATVAPLSTPPLETFSMPPLTPPEIVASIATPPFEMLNVPS